MEDSPFAPVSPSAAMSPAFVDSLNFSQSQLQKLAEIHAIWHQELSKLQGERNNITLSIQVRPWTQNAIALFLQRSFPAPFAL